MKWVLNFNPPALLNMFFSERKMIICKNRVVSILMIYMTFVCILVSDVFTVAASSHQPQLGSARVVFQVKWFLLLSKFLFKVIFTMIMYVCINHVYIAKMIFDTMVVFFVQKILEFANETFCFFSTYMHSLVYVYSVVIWFWYCVYWSEIWHMIIDPKF